VEDPLSLQQHRNYGVQSKSVGAVRLFVRELANAAGADVEAAQLLASELATNAVMHADTAFEVRVSDDGDTFRVEVVNDAPEMVAAMREPSGGGGRGLHIVNALAQRWGTYSLDGEKVVWFELPTTGLLPLRD
jgi:anti-sigma regulatory factor (Ser/Thr protein kinase)